MTIRPTDELIELLGAHARPVMPLRPPLHRALATLGVVAVLGGLAIGFLHKVNPFGFRAAQETSVALELLAMLATGALAITGAFFLSIPGRSKRWLAAPLPPFAAWLWMSGAGCYRDLLRRGSSGWEFGESGHCLVFILAVSALLGVPILWRLSRAVPINPLPVAMLGGLGVAALAAFTLQFFHPFAVTFMDLAVHLTAILLVVGGTAAFNRRALHLL